MNEARMVTVPEVAAALRVTSRAVTKRASKETWLFEVANKRGDRRFPWNGLPEDVRLAITAHEQNAAPKNRTLSLYNRCAPVSVGSPDLADFQNKVALARADLLRVYLQEKAQARTRGKSVIEAADDLLTAYNTGHLLPETFQTLGTVARPTIEAWAKAWRDSGHDYTALAPRWGNRKGQRKVTADEFNVLLSFALHPNRLRISEAVRVTKVALGRRATPSPSSPDTLRRALVDWRKNHYDQWVFAREGAKALNDRCLPFLERDAGLLEVGQVLVADGHKLNFQILHPFTGKPCRMNMVLWYDWASRWPCGFEIMPNENVQCVASSLRKAILNLGKIPQVAYLDNGKAFKARIFTDDTIDFEEAGFYGMFARLGIETVFAWPYNAQSKPVERFFETFGELERLLPTYTGTSIQDKPAWMMRNEKLHQAVHQKKYGGWVPTIEEAQVIINGWFAEYGQRTHEGLKGLCPADVFTSGKGPGVDPEALRHLMLSMEIGHIRRNGIPFLTRDYYAPELYGLRDRVLVKYDLSDLSHVLVFDITGKRFICRAEARQAVHPIARIAGTTKMERRDGPQGESSRECTDGAAKGRRDHRLEGRLPKDPGEARTDAEHEFPGQHG
jgi:putative transposase